MVDREPAYQLSIVDDEAQVTSVRMTRDEFTVGRKEGNVIRLTERNVSRAHSRIVRENGRFYVSDLGSYNGTRVNGRRIRGKVPLSVGDEIGIGDYVLRIEAVEGAAISAPPPVEVSKAPQVTVVIGGVPGAVHHLTDVPHVIGRGEEASIRIDDPSVSRVHAKLSLLQGRYFIEDARAGAGAGAGLLVSGRRVRTKALDPGDIVDIGPAQIYFTLGSLAPEEIRPPAAPKRASRLPMFAGIGALLAAVVGAVIAFGRGGDDPAGRGAGREGVTGPRAVTIPAGTDGEPSGPAQPAADHVEPAAAADPRPPEPDDGPPADEALAAARDVADKASTVEDWDAVLDMLQAKSLAASHEAAVIRAEAERERNARKALDEAADALARGAPWDAVPRLAAVPPEGTRSSEPARETWMRVIAAGRQDARRGRIEALRRVCDALGAVLAPPPDVARGREELVASLRRMEPPDAGAAPPAADVFVRVGPRDAGGGPAAEARGVPAPPPGAAADQAFSEARQMVIANNHAGCIEVLQRAPHTAKNMELLISCFSAAGRTAERLDAMQRYVQRFQTGRKADEYRNALQAAGRGP